MLPWITIAVDPVTDKVLIVGFGDTKEDCREHAGRVDTPYVRSFQINDDFGALLFGFLRDSGIPRSECTGIIQEIGRQLVDDLIPANFKPSVEE